MRLAFRPRIILIFSSITLLLSGLLSQLSYVALREIYFDQLADQVTMVGRAVAVDMDARYLDLLNPLDQGSAAVRYYRERLVRDREALGVAALFICDDRLSIVATSDTNRILTGETEPELEINRTEIRAIATGQASSSMAFKGRDGRWYMWGFFRLDENHWLCVQESAGRLARIEDLSMVFWGLVAGGVLLTVIGGWIVGETVAKPVDKLVQFSHELGQGSLSTPLPKRIQGELAILAHAMDGMRLDILRRQREKEQLLAHVAHEIRNPLGGIELLAGLVREDFVRERRNTEYLDQILGEIGRLKELITAYLQYGRPLPARAVEVDLHHALEEVRGILGTTLERRCVRLESDVNGTTLHFDPDHLRQILINLIGNAADAMEFDGRIRVSFAAESGAKLLRVTDDGRGLPPGDLTRLFEPFFTTRQGGFGLGLAICKKLCEENHAEIWCENNPGKGCTFFIRTQDGRPAATDTP